MADPLLSDNKSFQILSCLCQIMISLSSIQINFPNHQGLEEGHNRGSLIFNVRSEILFRFSAFRYQNPSR